MGSIIFDNINILNNKESGIPTISMMSLKCEACYAYPWPATRIINVCCVCLEFLPLNPIIIRLPPTNCKSHANSMSSTTLIFTHMTSAAPFYVSIVMTLVTVYLSELSTFYCGLSECILCLMWLFFIVSYDPFTTNTLG